MSPPLAKKVLLIGWDAADWKVISPLMDAGQMPNMERFVADGVMANIATLHPELSPTLWTSIATGKRPFKHGIYGFTEPSPDGTGIRPINNLSRRTKAVWNILSQEALRCNVIGWWPSHPAEAINGVMVSNRYQKAVASIDKPWPMRPGTVHPPKLAKALAGQRVHPAELTTSDIGPFLTKGAEIDLESADAHTGIARLRLRERRNLEAADAALRAVALVYFNPQAHFLLGVALHRLNRVPRAVEALKIAIAQNRNFTRAYRRLAYIYKRRLKEPGTAADYARQATEAAARVRANLEPMATPSVFSNPKGPYRIAALQSTW